MSGSGSWSGLSLGRALWRSAQCVSEHPVQIGFPNRFREPPRESKLLKIGGVAFLPQRDHEEQCGFAGPGSCSDLTAQFLPATPSRFPIDNCDAERMISWRGGAKRSQSGIFVSGTLTRATALPQ